MIGVLLISEEASVLKGHDVPARIPKFALDLEAPGVSLSSLNLVFSWRILPSPSKEADGSTTFRHPRFSFALS